MENKTGSPSILMNISFVLLIILLICSVIGNILLGYVGYKYLKLRDVYRITNEALIQSNQKTVQKTLVDTAINPFMSRPSSPVLSFEGDTITITPASGAPKTVAVTLDTNYEIQSVNINNKGDLLAVVTVSGSEAVVTESTKLSIINIANGKVLKTFKTGEAYSSTSKFELLNNVIFSNDDKTLYVGYNAGGSGGSTLGIDLNTYKVTSDFGGYLIGILPVASKISSADYKIYANDLLIDSRYYYVIGGGPYEISIANPKSGKVEKVGILEDTDFLNTDLMTFYNMFIK